MPGWDKILARLQNGVYEARGEATAQRPEDLSVAAYGVGIVHGMQRALDEMKEMKRTEEKLEAGEE
jgi:hypothetical protein